MVYNFVVPTIKQELLAKNLREYHGNMNKAMIASGYSVSSAKNPKRNIFTAKAWPEIMEKYFPDDFVAKQHKKLLTKKEFMAVGERGDRRIEPTGEIDAAAVARGVDMVYKLKGKYPREVGGGDTNIAVVNVVKFSDGKTEAKTVTSVAE